MPGAQSERALTPAEEKHQDGLRLLEQGQLDQALVLLTAALVDQPTSERWNDWAAAQMAAGHPDNAEEGFRCALGVEAAASQAAANLGLLLAGLGRAAEAVSFLKIALNRIGEPQRTILKQALADCNRKVAADALAHSQLVLQDLVGDLRHSWPLAPPSTPPQPSPGPPAAVARPLPLWDSDSEFDAICHGIKEITLDRLRCYILYQLAKHASVLPGHVAEVGVYKGGSATILSRIFASQTQKFVHLFDTFSGMPATDPTIDLHSAGDFADTSLEAVQRNLQGCRNLRFYPGFFPDTAPPVDTLRFCLV